MEKKTFSVGRNGVFAEVVVQDIEAASSVLAPAILKRTNLVLSAKKTVSTQDAAVIKAAIRFNDLFEDTKPLSLVEAAKAAGMGDYRLVGLLKGLTKTHTLVTAAPAYDENGEPIKAAKIDPRKQTYVNHENYQLVNKALDWANTTISAADVAKVQAKYDADSELYTLSPYDCALGIGMFANQSVPVNRAKLGLLKKLSKGEATINARNFALADEALRNLYGFYMNSGWEAKISV
jgi:hypothetical protein